MSRRVGPSSATQASKIALRPRTRRVCGALLWRLVLWCVGCPEGDRDFHGDDGRRRGTARPAPVLLANRREVRRIGPRGGP
ncbi:hypothetical protein NDU88_008169 [Pleurodeles waltl]|uniref:Secreted protein n=1 Tax=Pleurodeles waltl TaxID=8319 RepID=A0AAV7NVQ3_PLEWA|nr:hypothetical protein NDU88_008169 [Pleurodeles waltl]